MRYVVREGKVRGAGRYLSSRVGDQWNARRLSDGGDTVVFYSSDVARLEAKKVGGRVVRLVSREEAKQKARAEGRAEGLREAARAIRGMDDDTIVRCVFGVIPGPSSLAEAADAREWFAAQVEQMAAGGGG